MRHKVLLIDIDGVFCCWRTRVGIGTSRVDRTFDPVGIGMVNQICKEYNVELAVLSTWRMMPNIGDILRVAGFKGKYFSGTITEQPDDPGFVYAWNQCSGQLGMSILGSGTGSTDVERKETAIDEWSAAWGSILDRFAILDDVPIPKYINQQIVTDPFNGILYAHYAKLVEVFK